MKSEEKGRGRVRRKEDSKGGKKRINEGNRKKGKDLEK
jgi:hypothetical protein